MKRILKNIFIAHMIVLITFTGSPAFIALAEEATPAATIKPPSVTQNEASLSAETSITQATDSGELLPLPSTEPAPINRLPDADANSFKKSQFPELSFDDPVMSSAVIKQPLKIRSMDKKDYAITEPVTAYIDNATSEDIEVLLFDTNDIEIDAEIQLSDNAGSVTVRMTPPVNVKPGKYILQVTDAAEQVAEMDFTWGVIAFNTDKTIYTAGEKVTMFIGVTDEQGNIACDAAVMVKIIDPDKKETDLSSDNDTITTNPACKQHKPSEQSDFETSYIALNPGTYDIKVRAKTTQGTYSFSDTVLVTDTALPYTVQRVMPTRIYPRDPFAVTLNITANEDFTGTIRDIVPGDFVITPSTNSATLQQITNRVSSASAERRTGPTYPIGQIRLPFDGDYPLSLDFSGTIQDPLLKDLYINFGLLGHDGLDFAMPIGTQLLATDTGTVIWAGPGDYGQTVIIEHTWGRSYYGHLSTITVTEGQTLSRGTPIGLSGNTGISTGPHLHFGIKPLVNDEHNGYYGKIDPLPYLSLSENSQILATKTTGDLQEVKVIAWDVVLKKGESVSISYNIKAPETHPAAYLVGPAQFVTTSAEGTSETIVQSDSRMWHTLADQSPVLGVSTAKEFTKFAMQTIDPALFAVPEGYPQMTAVIDDTMQGEMSSIQVANDTVTTRFSVPDAGGENQQIEFSLQNFTPHQTTKGPHTITKSDIFPNVDMQYTPHDGYLQQVLTIKSDQARREFGFAVTLSDDIEFKNIDSTSGHVIAVHKTTGEELFTFRFPQGIDAANQRIDYKYRIENNELVLYPNRVWQYDQAVFPIKIYAPINAIAWTEAEVLVGDSCEETTPCERDGDILAVKPAGWHWSLSSRKQNAIVKLDKLSSEVRRDTEAKSVSTENTDDPHKPKVFKGKDKQRVAAYEGLSRFGIDYTTLATPGQLSKIRNKNKQEYAPMLDARKKKGIIRKKTDVTAGVISREKKLAYQGIKEPNFFAKIARAIFKPASAATIQTATIGSAGGRDYADPAAWETANDNNLVTGDLIEQGVMYNDSVYSLGGTNYSISGATTDATRYMWLTVAESDRHNGTAGTGVRVDGGASSASGVVISNIGTVVEWIEFYNISGTSGLSAIITQNGATSVVVQYLIIHDMVDLTQDNSAVRTSSSSTDAMTIRNSIIYDYDRYAIRGNGAADTINVENVTMWGNSTESDFGISENASAINSENCIAMNNLTTDFVYGTLGTNTNNLSEDASADDDGGAGHKISQSASIQFSNTTAGSENFHLISTSTAIDSGTSSVGLTDDIDGFTREGTFDIGADEFPNPPLYTLMRHGKYFSAGGVKQPFTF